MRPARRSPIDARSAELERLERYDAADHYTLAIVTDEGQASLVELEDGATAWQATLRYDRLYREANAEGRPRYRRGEIAPEDGGIHRLISLVGEGGRGAEFSELVLFGGRLLAFDDRTGLACEIRANH